MSRSAVRSMPSLRSVVAVALLLVASPGEALAGPADLLRDRLSAAFPDLAREVLGHGDRFGFELQAGAYIARPDVHRGTEYSPVESLEEQGGCSCASPRRAAKPAWKDSALQP